MKTQLLTAILTLSSSTLFAGTITHQGLDWSRGMSIEFNADGADRRSSAGVGQVLVDGTTLIDAFCVNLFKGITVGTTYRSATMSAGDYDSDGGTASWLMTAFLPVVNTAVEGAALQLAIWDAIHDSGDGFAAGRIRSNGRTDSAVLALANQWRTLAIGQTAAGSVYYGDFQEQLGIPGASEVPEPSTLTLAIVGGLAVAFGAWRKAK